MTKGAGAERILRIPDDVRVVIATPLAYPPQPSYDDAAAERLGRRSRKELKEIAYLNQWGSQAGGLAPHLGPGPVLTWEGHRRWCEMPRLTGKAAGSIIVKLTYWLSLILSERANYSHHTRLRHSNLIHV